jgi:hypothetical protein
LGASGRIFGNGDVLFLHNWTWTDSRATPMASCDEEEVACDRVPVTVLTGFLGSGKTTLLNHILTATHGKKIAIIENEFGAVAIDDKLLAKNTKFQTGEEIFEVLNGCMCCTVRTDLVKVLHKLASRIDSGKLVLDGIIIETTGMADPSPVGTCAARSSRRRTGGSPRTRTMTPWSRSP